VTKRVLGDEWLLPVLDARNQEHFTAGVLMIQSCRDCGHSQHPPEDLCRRCGSHEVGARPSAGLGRVESVAVVHHAVHPLLKPHVPYAVVLVAVDDAPGVRLLGNVVNATPHAITIGARVRAVFEHTRDPHTGGNLAIPQWELLATSA
jgi:hypothetical protein